MDFIRKREFKFYFSPFLVSFLHLKRWSGKTSQICIFISFKIICDSINGCFPFCYDVQSTTSTAHANKQSSKITFWTQNVGREEILVVWISMFILQCFSLSGLTRHWQLSMFRSLGCSLSQAPLRAWIFCSRVRRKEQSADKTLNLKT